MDLRTKQQRVTEAVLREIIPVASVHDDEGGQFQKEKKARRYCAAFAAKMQSSEPFQSVDEAVQALAPVAIWFFGRVARRFAIMILKALWRHWHSDTE
jgi:hypothetical protein